MNLAALKTIAAELEGMHEDLAECNETLAQYERRRRAEASRALELERLKARARELSRQNKCGYAVWLAHEGFFLTHISVIPGGMANPVARIHYHEQEEQ